MNPKSVVCPKCQNEFSVDEVLTHQIEESVGLKYKQEAEKIREEDRKKLLAWKEEKEKALFEKEKAFRENLEEKLKKELSEQASVESKKLEEELVQKTKLLEESKLRELGLLKKEGELAQKLKDADLEIQRKLTEERQKIWAKAEAEASEKHLLKEKEQSQVIESLKKSLEEAQRKAAQGSQQLQGEVQELELEKVLTSEFPFDEIVPVPKGVSGADILQKVHDENGRFCGTIIWESKRTKNWGGDWIQKLKDDLRLVKADVAILVSSVLPEEIKNFGPKDGVYVTDFEHYLNVVRLIRLRVIDLSLAKASTINQEQKQAVLYNYIRSNEFAQRVEAIAEAFKSLREDLEKEKRMYQTIWSKREKQIQRVLDNTFGMYGDLQALIGSSMQIKGLETDNLELVGVSEVMLSVEVEEPNLNID